ncbi:MAG: ATP-dependent helicase [Bacteroidota bacterium]
MARRFVLKKEPDAAPSTLTIDYAGELNGEQHAAATAGPGPVLIVAGAGTGKTRTLVYRVAYLIETGARPEEILLLTFTRRAAREMLGRAAGLLDGRCERVRGGTFHAFCLQVLRRHAEAVGYPKSFTILDASDAADVIDLLRSERGLHRSKKRFPKKRTLQNLYSAAANRGLDVADVLEQTYPQFLIHLDEIEDLGRAFSTYKQRHGLVDYDDLLALTVRLLENDEAVRKKVAGACRWVLVDEYQDTNRLQARLVELFASVHGNVTAVGDDAQSIYRFRGADVGNILAFPDTFPGTRLFKLEQNYRSTQPILDLANFVLDRAKRKYEKRLYTETPEGEKPALIAAPDDRWQSRFVCDMLLQLREEGTALGRMAVLFRSGYNSYDLEVELDRRRVPFVKFGGLRLTEAAHIKDVVAHLRVAENPLDVVAWNRVLKLIEGIGPRTARDLVDWVLAAEQPYTLAAPAVSPRFEAKLRHLGDLLQRMRAGDVPLPAQVEALLSYYQPVLEQVYFEDHPKRAQDLESFAGLAEGRGSRSAFLESLALDPIDLTATDVEGTHKDEAPLVLSTIHSAKGLEFDTVFLIQALDGILPSQYAAKSDEELDEELRLLYVALTRAERNLFVSYPTVQTRRRAGDFFTNPSRFLADVPEPLLEPWTLAEEGDAEPAQLDAPPRPQLPPARDTNDGLPF